MFFDLKNFHFRMEIINKSGEIDLNKWMEKVNDSHGFVRWGYKCL
jgi:hypothetical protein